MASLLSQAAVAAAERLAVLEAVEVSTPYRSELRQLILDWGRGFKADCRCALA